MDSVAVARQVNLSDYWDILKRRAWVVIAFFIICSATVTLGTFLATPLYQAGTTIIVEGENTNVLNAADSQADGSSFELFQNYIETQIAIIKSDKIAGKVYQEFNLDQTPRYQRKVILGKAFQRKFISDVTIERVRDTRMIEISVLNPDPKMAADVANRLAEIYVQDNMMRRSLAFIRNQRMASLNADFLRLQSKLDSLSNTLGPKHPEMIALKEEIRAMADRIKNGQTATGGNSAAENQTLMEDTLSKVQENSVFSSSKINNIAIVDKAVPYFEIAKPRRLLNVALGLFLGAIGGILCAFFVDHLDDSVKTENDVRRILTNEVYLGHLFSEKKSARMPTDVPSPFDHLVANSKNSPSAEAYRLLRTRVLWSASADGAAKDLLVLSCVPREGKSTVASNLAIAFAQSNLKVLLVDTDLRRGRVHDSYGLANDKGLAHYLTGGVHFESVVKETAIPGLSVVTCGSSDIDSSQLFGSTRMKQFIEEAKRKFDKVIYDTPPFTVISDTALLMPLIGSAILVARSGVTNARLLQKGLLILREFRAHFLGIVLNDVSSSETRAYGHYYHSYQRQ